MLLLVIALGGGVAGSICIAQPSSVAPAETEDQSMVVTYGPDERVTPRTKTIVAPTYPREYVEGSIQGYLDVVFTINRRGKAVDPRIAETQLPSEFSTAALASIRESTFYFQPFDDECNASPPTKKYTLRVFFEYKGEQPHVQFAQPKAPRLRGIRLIHMPAFEYPRELGNSDGCVMVSFHVTRTGEVADVDFLKSVPDNRFNDYVEKQVRQVRFDMVGEGPREHGARVRMPIFFWRP